MHTRAEYEVMLQALGVCICARVPFLLWGDPGEGKTAVVESARAHGWHVETLIISHHEPSDFAGLPVVVKGGVTLAPPLWAQRLAAHDGPSIAFFDEWTTAAPAVQAAALRPLTHYQVGALQLPATVSFGAAANHADIATAGWELAAPTANRFCHFEWNMPLEVYAESLVTQQWPGIPLYAVPAAYDAGIAAARVQVAGFLRARGSQLKAIPGDADGRGRAFCTPRTWDYAARLMALAVAVGAHEDAVRLLVSGTIGAATAHEFVTWIDQQDLPDPEDLLATENGRVFAKMRPDRVYVVLQSLLAAVVAQPTPQRWAAAIRLCAAAAGFAGLDPAVPVVRALVRDGVRPAGSQVPPEIKVFATPLALAGLLQEPAA
ncbi:MAG: AAA family ATPase [Actinomycetota bacterium]